DVEDVVAADVEIAVERVLAEVDLRHVLAVDLDRARWGVREIDLPRRDQGVAHLVRWDAGDLVDPDAAVERLSRVVRLGHSQIGGLLFIGREERAERIAPAVIREDRVAGPALE